LVRAERWPPSAGFRRHRPRVRQRRHPFADERGDAGDELARLSEAFRAAEHAVDSGFKPKRSTGSRWSLRLQARKSDDFNKTLAALRARARSFMA